METMKCSNPAEVYRILKASTLIQNQDLNTKAIFLGLVGDIPDDFQHCIILRRWGNLSPNREFRVFVAERRVLGISQRSGDFYDHMQNAWELERLRALLT